MESTNIHEVIVNKDNMQTISADAAFYSFMGERLYLPFEKLVMEEDKKVFSREFKECNGERFMMRLVGENGKQGVYFSRVKEGPSENSIKILLLYAESLVEIRSQLQKTVSIRNAILGMYNDTYFEYEPENGMIRMYTMEIGEQNVERFPLEEFERRLTVHADENQKKDVHELIVNIKTGMRRFEMRAGKNLISEEGEDCLMTIGIKSVYEKGVFSIAVGCIHIGRDFGQDIRKKIELDSLTGLVTKADITRIAIDIINVKKVKGITLAIVDIDYFKNVNDTYGHMCGDEVLSKVAAIMEKEVGDNGLVGRIGGDEFLIIFYHADDMENMRERLKCIKNNVKASFPPGIEGQPAITLSMGCAAYPKDGDTYEDLFFLADFALYRAKEKGRDRYIIFNKEKHGDPEEIRNTKKEYNQIDSRGNMSMGDVLCVMMDSVYRKKEYPLERLLDDFVINFGIQRVMIHAGEPYRITCVAGEQRPEAELIAKTQHYINADGYLQQFDEDGVFCMNNVKFLEDKLNDVYELLGKLSICSLIQIKLTDKNGVPAILSLESVKGLTTWNRSNLHYYRLFARLLSEYELA
ncbi:MAG: GGDEF domain-containing protein [Bacillus sp. (in: Bacteria)]|nr:GGDEF domain-containing protein [Bacillus sp. (in: firmicutes)]MCM1426352.1 GGDEF domain-containing protein [Eubacterium sp.]